MRDHIHAVVGRCKGKIQSRDVANNPSATQDGLVDDADQRLTATYGGTFRAFLKQGKSVGMANFWEPNDGNA